MQTEWTGEMILLSILSTWEQRKLGKVLDFSIATNSLSRSMLNYDKGELMSIHYGDILINYGSILNVSTDRDSFYYGWKIERLRIIITTRWRCCFC